ncbi:MAG TPA: choice-of-anchor D domain-containing protein [Candidatus Binatia bacterium]|nr:choice-of-anchor D domain-containing protein [Candidatus Binatia bacterium]
MTGFLNWVVAADFSGGGKTDLAVTNIAPSGVSVLKGNGDGTFQSGVFYPAGREAGYIVAADLNGDRKPDLALVDRGSSSIFTLLNTGVVSFSPTTPLNFKNQTVGTTSAAQTVTLTNTGTTALNIASMKASLQFAVTSTCGSNVASGASCTISATFSPTKKGAAQGTISIVDSASTKPMVIELLGTGT